MLYRRLSGFFIGCATLAAQCTLPPAPSQGVPDSYFNALATQNGPGWTGGDGTYSLALPDGRYLWMWSDSFIGTVDPNTRLRAGWLFTAHNSLTVQDTVTNTVTTVGYPPKTTSYFVPQTTANWFWIGDGMVIQPSPGVYKIKIYLLEWTGVFQFKGNSVATLSWPALTIDSIQKVALPDLTIQWGSRLLRDRNYIYNYGIKDPGTANKLPYVARMSSVTDLTNPANWQYWSTTARAWVSGQANATNLPGVPGITNEYKVDRMNASTGPFYLMTGMDPRNPPYPGWNAVTTYYACAPWGPWTTRTVVYTTPETGAPGCKTGTLLTYNPKAHAEFTSGDQVLLSYNVNTSDGHDQYCADDYKPRFIRVQIPGLISVAPPPEP
ncbi:MAG: DUF5005 domain-containing protein [Bryobacteraceae bacterium]